MKTLPPNTQISVCLLKYMQHLSTVCFILLHVIFKPKSKNTSEQVLWCIGQCYTACYKTGLYKQTIEPDADKTQPLYPGKFILIYF